MPKGMQAIYTQTIGSGGVASIAFNNIPQTYTDLYLLVSGRNSASFASPFQATNLYVRFNNDSTSGLYSTTVLYGTGAAAFSTRNVAGNNSAYIGVHPSSNAATSSFGNTTLHIPNYTSTAFKTAQSESSAASTSTLAEANYMILACGLYRSNAPITRIDIIPGSDLFVQHSSITLYGISR